MNAFHYPAADNLTVQFYLHPLYSLYSPVKWGRRLLGYSCLVHTHLTGVLCILVRLQI